MLFSKNYLYQKERRDTHFQHLSSGWKESKIRAKLGIWDADCENSGEFRKRDLNTTGYSRTVSRKGIMACWEWVFFEYALGKKASLLVILYGMRGRMKNCIAQVTVCLVQKYGFHGFVRLIFFLLILQNKYHGLKNTGNLNLRTLRESHMFLKL